MSSAWRSGTSTSSSVSGDPVTRSALMMLAPPTRCHSARMLRTGTFSARSVTRPLLICSCIGACAWDSAAEQRKTAASAGTLNVIGHLIVRCAGLVRAHVLDDRPDDVVELHFRLVVHECTDFRDVRNP